MTSKQYEELCRLFLAQRFEIDMGRVVSIDYPNAVRHGLPEFHHQIDLYWEIETCNARYVHIANAKWRTPPDLVGMADVLLLQQVKIKLAAHKAFLITSTGYTSDAIAAAADDGVALHVLTPRFDTGPLDPADRSLIQSQLQALLRPGTPGLLYVSEVVHKSLPVSAPAAAAAASGGPRAADRDTVFPSPAAGAQPSAGYMTKQGRIPGLRTKGSC